MYKLLTKKNLAERWQVSEKAIDNWRKEGVITPCSGIPSVRFNEQHILELEGIKLERFSPLEKKKLERENEELRLENEKLKGILANILVETSKIINL
jgi:DNA gyrase/topoisomerase IV subunit A